MSRRRSETESAALPGAAQPSANNQYLTLTPGGNFRHELVIKRSRFITVLSRIHNEDQAKNLQAELRKEFYDARHHCFAMILGPGQDVLRSNDDGEPSGTAGVPMLEVLRKFSVPGQSLHISDCCAIVVRYFGGVLLGAGGLVRAYSESVSQALQAAPLVRREKLSLFTLSLPHAEAARAENELRAAGITMTGNSYESQNTVLGLAFKAVQESIDDGAKLVAHISAGQASLTFAGNEWVDTALRT